MDRKEEDVQVQAQKQTSKTWAGMQRCIITPKHATTRIQYVHTLPQRVSPWNELSAISAADCSSLQGGGEGE